MCLIVCDLQTSTIKRDEISGAFGMHGREDQLYMVFMGKLE